MSRIHITNPDDTVDVNVKGTLNVLEACSINGVKNFIFASSAAVYGEPKKLPLSEDDHLLEPLSPYGASKELEKHLYHHIETPKRLKIPYHFGFSMFMEKVRILSMLV